jgi:hypothetical protein
VSWSRPSAGSPTISRVPLPPSRPDTQFRVHGTYLPQFGTNQPKSVKSACRARDKSRRRPNPWNDDIAVPATFVAGNHGTQYVELRFPVCGCDEVPVVPVGE